MRVGTVNVVPTMTVEAPSLGEGWLESPGRSSRTGTPRAGTGRRPASSHTLTLEVASPDSADALIAELGDPDWLDWMHRNFFVAEEVPELGRAKSYAMRLFDYGGTGRDQIAWVVDRLRADPECRDAAITTFQPLTDTSYIPCVSLLDFWLREGGWSSSSTRTASTSARRPTATSSSSPTFRSTWRRSSAPPSGRSSCT